MTKARLSQVKRGEIKPLQTQSFRQQKFLNILNQDRKKSWWSLQKKSLNREDKGKGFSKCDMVPRSPVRLQEQQARNVGSKQNGTRTKRYWSNVVIYTERVPPPV